MAIYRIEWKTSALKELKLIDRSAIPRILSTIESLKSNPRPHGVRKLEGSRKSYRIRIGDYRVIYDIEDEVLRILIILIRHRKTVYDN